MSTNLSSTSNKNSEDPSEDFMAEEAESSDFDSDAEAVPPRPSAQKDPSIRRKIEDRLERKRLREELGIYDDESWKDL
jgi:hypothetical protein